MGRLGNWGAGFFRIICGIFPHGTYGGTTDTVVGHLTPCQQCIASAYRSSAGKSCRNSSRH
jgi:hypothetical protein